MPYRRRRTYRKRPTAKRSYRRRFRTRTRYNKRGTKLYLFKRHVDFGELTIDNVNFTYSSYNFSLSDLPSATDFTNLYDQYKINCVKIRFLPQQTQSISIGSINNPRANTRFFSAIDYNDGNPPTSVDELRQYQTCKYTPCLRQHKRVIFKPKILDTNGFSISPWMSTATPNANYFGIKIAVEPMESTSTLTMTYTVECTYYMSFKQVK